MKILVVGDCHGKVPNMDEEASEADFIIATGDICGDSDEMREAMFKSIDSEREWYDILGREKSRKYIQTSLEEGENVLNYLNDFGKPVLLIPGNWDWIGGNDWEVLEENRFQQLVDEFENIHNINRTSLELEELSFIGYGPCSGPEVPQYEDEKPDDPGELEEMREEYNENRKEISELFKASKRPVVFLSHNVPHNTSLDMIDNPDSPADGRHYGSLVVRDMIEEYSPLLSIGGHIHEGAGNEKVEGITCINGGLHSQAEIKLNEDTVKQIKEL